MYAIRSYYALGRLSQKPFAQLISLLRARKVKENYRDIGGSSPLLHWTRLQAEGIAERLGPEFRPYVVMRYWSPRAEETLRQMAADGIEEAVVLSMYPHYTDATTGSSLKDFYRTAEQVYPQLVITSYSIHYTKLYEELRLPFYFLPSRENRYPRLRTVRKCTRNNFV